ncbi:MAG TPA: 30S ribosome-binding factor RbfA [Clostridiaceae bacterium]|nr:30S ribosome-binding factor RbfA [Clostridiaceae bacterium]
MVDRIARISEEIKREVGNIIQSQLKDPRLPEFTSVTEVEVSRDLRYAKVYISILGSEKEKKLALQGLKSAAGFIRHEIGKRIKLRYTPEFQFELDDSIERGVYLNKLISEVVKDDNKIINDHAKED